MKGGRDPAKARQWNERFARYKISRRTVAQFCHDEGVSVPSFYQWKRKLAAGSAEKRTSSRRRSRANNGKARRFRRVELSAATSIGVASVAEGVTVRMPDGIEIMLGNDLPVIQRVVGQLLERGRGGEGSC